MPSLRGASRLRRRRVTLAAWRCPIGRRVLRLQDKLKKEEEQKKRLVARLGVAQFLQASERRDHMGQALVLPPETGHERAPEDGAGIGRRPQVALDDRSSTGAFFLPQDTVEEMAKDLRDARSGETAASAEELMAFMNRVRSGQPVSNKELLVRGFGLDEPLG